MSDKRTKRTDKRTESAMAEWKALIAEAKGDDWDSREVLLAANRVVRAARAWAKTNGGQRDAGMKKTTALMKAIAEMER